MEPLGRQEAPPKNAAAQEDGSITRVSPSVDLPLHIHTPPPSKGNDRKRAKTDDTTVTFRTNNRRTKKDYRKDLELMNAASDKIMFLNSENAQLRLRLEKAQADNATIQIALNQERLALQQERQLSMDRESSNRALRVLLLEERVRAATRVQNSGLYQGLPIAPPSLSLGTPPISRASCGDPIEDYRLSTARGMHSYAPVVVSTKSGPPREGLNSGDAPKPMNQQSFHSRLTAQDLALVIEKSRW